MYTLAMRISEVLFDLRNDHHLKHDDIAVVLLEAAQRILYNRALEQYQKEQADAEVPGTVHGL